MTPLTPVELARAMAAYRASGTFAAAARAIGRDETGVRRALRRHLAPARSELIAEELDGAHHDALRAVSKARRKASRALDAAVEPRDIALLGRALADVLRATTAARTAHARLTAPDADTDARRVVVTELSDEELDHELDREARRCASTLARRAAEGDASALEALEALAAMADTPADVVVELPRSLARPREH